MKVLVAEDDGIQRLLLEKALTEWGFEALPAGDGDAAWKLLQGEQAPDLVLLDWMMPGLDGVEVCKQLRQSGRGRYTYVLVLSARAGHADMLAALEAGADDYLIKPFDPAELKARLNTGRRILHLQNELIAAREAMRRQATRDSLTGTWNHAAILEVLEHELGRSRREGKPVAVILTDLDHFKNVNDTFGHLTGDAVLCEFTARTTAALRPYDLVGRYGGEEFLVVLPNCDEAAVAAVSERLRRRVAEQPFTHGGREVTVTASVGAAVSRNGQGDAAALVQAADQALYRAKAAGRNCVEIAPPL
jgi:two-component system cell cycle response regulator